ncbi:hypothetical protein FD755_009835 [Muntiacus reevesi]|uniref:40S ribosomal protein S3a n=1 Tax=Muntiacus reevesi TaxID=9886 RepID=A0A5N3XY43_MUNRE|nr:hypothetical protein FD755_009835 [Muntiacus reevesi]
MAVVKNKRLTKGGKKRAKKTVVDPVSKKDWYDMKASVSFNIRNIGKNLVTRTQGTKITSDGLRDCVFEMSLTNLQNDEVAFRKFKLIIENVQGKNCLTNFHGMDLIRNIFHGQKTWKPFYARHWQVRQIPKKTIKTMTREGQRNDLKEAVNKLIPDSTGKDFLNWENSWSYLVEGSSSGKATGDETGAKVK